jgi:hypothetical protein
MENVPVWNYPIIYINDFSNLFDHFKISQIRQPTTVALPTAVTRGGKLVANGSLQGVGPTATYRRAARW